MLNVRRCMKEIMEMTVKIEGIKHTTGRLSHLPHIVEKATVSALNKIGAQGMTATRREVTREYNIKQKDLKGNIKLIRARRGTKSREGRLFAIISVTGKSIPLYKFAAKPKEPPVQKGIPVKRRKPVTVKVKKTGGRKRLSHAFVARMRSGHVGIFTRKSSESLPIHELFSVSIPKMFKMKGKEAVDKIAKTKGRQILQHELDFYLKREAGLL